MLLLPWEGTHCKSILSKKKKKNRSIQGKANLVQEAGSDEDEVFSVYHQIIIGGKIAPYVANMKIKKGKCCFRNQ